MDTREIEVVSQKIVDLFGPLVESNTQNSEYDTCEEFDDFDIGEDYQCNTWNVDFTVDMSHEDVKDHLVTTFGPPDKEVFRDDLNLSVNNWDLGKVHIVQFQDRISLYQRYTKV